MKGKINHFYNNTSKFFWYPPKDLLTELSIKELNFLLQHNKFPGFGKSYTQSSMS